MQRKEKNEIYSIRKFKVGVGSALIGLSVLGATGLVNDVPIVSDVFGVETAHAAEGDTRTIEVTWLEAHSFKELGKNQATSVDNGDGTFTTTFTALPGNFAPKKVRLYQHEFSDKINVVAYDWLGSNVPDHDGPDNTKPSDFGLTDVFGKPTAYLINADQLDGKKMTPVFYFTPKSYADGSRGFMLARAIGTKSTTSEKVLKATTRYEKDDTREKGAENVVAVAAKDGKEITTTSYVFRKKDGSVVEPMFNDAKVNPNDLNNINPDDYVTGTPKTTTEAPVNGVIKVAAKDKVVYSKKGNDVIKSTTVYTVNPDNGSITEKTTEEVIKANGAKDTVATTPIPSPKRYEKDATREKGQPNIETKGTDGVSSITTTYTVNPQTGATNGTAGQPVVTKQATDTVIKVAAKDKVVRELKPSPIRYEKDTTREKGAENITVKGKDGSVVTTTTYNVDSNTGNVTETVGEPVTTNPTETVVKVAAKDKVDTKTIPSPVRYEADTEKDFGTPNVETKGKPGQEVLTTIYTVDPKTGNVTDKSTPVRTEPTATVVKVGTKPKVVTRTDDQGRKVTETTTYTVDTTTGKVTPTTKTTYGEKANTVEKKVVPSPVRYEKDATREKGQPNITNKGKDGEDQITTTYKVDSVTGKVNQIVGQPVRTVQPTETVVKVAAKDKTEVVTRGNKKFEVTTSYMVDPKTGTITEKMSDRELPNTDAENFDANKKVPENVVKPEVSKEKVSIPEKDSGEVSSQNKDDKKVTSEKVVENNKGKDDEKVTELKITDKVTPSKPTSNESKDLIVKEKPVPSKVVYEKDVTREKGSENITVKGKDGETVIKVAAKDKVETIRQNGDTIERSTKYMVNPETGKVTEEVTDKLISSNGLGIKPPVAENNNANENTSVTDKLEHKDIVSSNGSDENGNVIKPLVNEKPEYKGVDANENGNSSVTDKPENNVSSENTNVENNNADEHTSVSDKSENNGNVVKPLVNEKPEFDLSTLEKEPKKTIDVKTVSNDFGPKKDTKKDEFNFISVNDDKTSVTKSSEKPGSEKPVRQLPNTAGGDNMAINALGALTLSSVLGLAATKRKKEN